MATYNDRAELGKPKSSRRQKKKKKAQQHQINSAFLGFKYQRETDQGMDYFPSSVTTKRSSYKTPRKTYDRNDFLKATYRFILSGPSASETNNPYMVGGSEKKIDWSDVEQVLFDVEEGSNFSCPICLCEPELPMMNCCGHIYCMLCVLRLLNKSTRKNWVKCPICNDPVTQDKLRSTKARNVAALTPRPNNNHAKNKGGSNIMRLNLMYRSKVSIRPTFAYSKSIQDEEWNNVLQHRMPTVVSSSRRKNNEKDILKFTQFLRCTKEYMNSILTKEIQTLHKVVEEAKQDANFLAIIGRHEDSIKENELILHLHSVGMQIFAEKALRWELHELIAVISNHNEVLSKRGEESVVGLDEDEFPSLARSNSIKDDAQSAETEKKGISTLPQSPRREKETVIVQGDHESAVDLSRIGTTNKGFYFYQLQNGSKTFLHPFCINVLKEEYKSFDKFPAEITGRLLDVETVTLTKEKMKFFKYLSHLNLNAEIKLVDIDLVSHISKETKKKMKKEFQKRKRQRDKKFKNSSSTKERKSRDCPSPEVVGAKIEKERKESLAPKNFPSVGSPPKPTNIEPVSIRKVLGNIIYSCVSNILTFHLKTVHSACVQQHW